MASGGDRVKTGSVVGTGALLTVRTVGFRPKRVRLFGAGAAAVDLQWNDAMPNDSGRQAIADGTNSFVSSGGVIPLSDGFSIGTNTVNTAAQLIYWECDG